MFALVPLLGFLFAAPDELRLADGRQLDAVSVTFDEQRVVFQLADGSSEEVSLGEVVEWRAASVTLGAASDLESAVAVHLHDGSWLVGEIAAGDEDGLELELAPAARARFSVDAVRALLFGERAAILDPARFERPGQEVDAIYRNRRAGGDFTTGHLIGFGPSSVQFEYSLGETEFAHDDLLAVVLSALLEPEEPEGIAVVVDLRPAGKLRGEWQSADAEAVEILPLFAEEPVRIPRDRIHALRFHGPGHRWLSETAPAAVRETPFVGEPDLFLYPFRVDRSVTGVPLEVGERRFATGFGCHSRCELEFDLSAVAGGPWQEFSVFVGVSDEVLGLADPGCCDFSVWVDGEMRAQKLAVRGGLPASELPPVDVRGARRLVLRVDFGEGQDVADRAVWGDPLLWANPASR